jgi:hypothetical protein
MQKKEHLSMEGIEKIIKLSSNMNKQRSFEDKYKFCNDSLGLKKLPNGEFEVSYNLPPHWIQTFLSAESVFYNYVSEKKSRGKIYQGLDSSLEIGQNSHDIAVLLAIKKFFNGGYTKPKYNYMNLFECQNSRSVNRYVLRDTEKIIKFVDQYPMLTRKHLDYLDWKRIVESKNIGSHKTEKGLSLILDIISKMNSRRD